MSILNQMRKNPAMTAAGFLFIVALIVLIGWLVTRGSKGSTGPGAASGLPELSVSGEKTVKSIKTSEYSIMREYARGDYLGDNIDFKLTLNTKGGFEENKITKLVAQRIADDGTTITSKELTNITNYHEYIFHFPGQDITGNAVAAVGGKNTFNIIGYTSDTDEYKIVSPLATQDIDISAADLNYVLGESMVSTFTFSLATDANATILDVAMGDISRSEYFLSILPGVPLNIIPKTGGYSFQYEDKTTLLTVGTTTVFNLDKFGEKYRLYSGDKMVTKEGGTGALVLKKPNDMITAEADVALMAISEASPLRMYPPKPYPNATGGVTVTNTYKWTVAGSGYGEGEYRVEAANSLLIDATFDGGLDAEGFFNKGISSVAGLVEGEDAYHSNKGGGVSWFHFYLPVYIALDRLDIYPRGYKRPDAARDEIAEMESKWSIAGVDRSTGSPVETRLYTNDKVTFTDGEIKSLKVTTTRKFNEFKVAMDPIGANYMVFNELLFYGREDTPADVMSSQTMYDRNILHYTATGYDATHYHYGSDISCHAKCLEDDTCDGIQYTDTTHSTVKDGACWKLSKKDGEATTYAVHTHYSTSLKAPVLVYQNPPFTAKSTVDITGTPWSADGWDTYMSSTAHTQVYQSWHPFSHDASKTWSSWTAPDESVGIKYPKPVILKAYIIDSSSDGNNYTPKSVIVEGSNDGTTWAPLKTSTTSPSDAVGYKKNRTTTVGYEDMSSNTTPYSYYRVRIPGGGVYNNISDFKLFTTLSA